MKNIKFGTFFFGLALATAGVVSLAAQDRFEVGPRGRADVRVFGSGGQLGIRVSDTESGVRVDDVSEGSAAEKAGLREGDVIIEFDGERVRSAMQLTRLVRETPDGRTVRVGVTRDGQRQDLQATPESRGGFAFDFDGDRLRDEIERSMRGRIMPLRGRLGVTLQSLTPDLEEYFGATKGGALVSSVARESAAAKAGLKAGDVITAIDGRGVRSAGDVMRQLGDRSGEIEIAILRDKQAMTLKATIGRD